QSIESQSHTAGSRSASRSVGSVGRIELRRQNAEADVANPGGVGCTSSADAERISDDKDEVPVTGSATDTIESGSYGTAGGVAQPPGAPQSPLTMLDAVTGAISRANRKTAPGTPVAFQSDSNLPPDSRRFAPAFPEPGPEMPRLFGGGFQSFDSRRFPSAFP